MFSAVPEPAMLAIGVASLPLTLLAVRRLRRPRRA